MTDIGRHQFQPIPGRDRCAGSSTKDSDRVTTRGMLWSYLVICPGRTAHEIARGALGKRGPTSASIQSGSTLRLLQAMERDGQVTRQQVRRPGQGKPVSEWYAVPGVFAIAAEVN